MPRYWGIDSGYGLWVQHRFQGRSLWKSTKKHRDSPSRRPRNSGDSRGTLSMYCQWYPLVNCYIAMERSTIFHGKIGKSTISIAIFHCYVSSPEGIHICVPGIFPKIFVRYSPMSICFFETIHHCYELLTLSGVFFQDLQPIILSSFYHHVSHFPHVPISIGYLRKKKGRAQGEARGYRIAGQLCIGQF